MRLMKTTAASAALGAALLFAPVGGASAMPAGAATGAALGTAAAETLSVVQVQRRYYRGGYYRGGPRYYRGGYRGGSGAGIAAGLAAGALLGGVIASQAAPPPAYYVAPARDPAIDYCMQRFRSYDPVSMTYMGYDGRRHPCP